VIEKSYSPWVSPAVLVNKKDGSIRFCVDFKKLNVITKKDSYPNPQIDMLDRLAGNSWFSSPNLKRLLASENFVLKIKRKFFIDKGLWQFTLMPFDLCNALATFERLMEKVLLQLLNKICLVYLDDVIIFSKDYEDWNVWDKFSCGWDPLIWSLIPKKCFFLFLKKEIKYLGHVVLKRRVSTDEEKISSVRNLSVPRTKN